MAIIYIAATPKARAESSEKDDATIKLIGIFSLQVRQNHAIKSSLAHCDQSLGGLEVSPG